MSNSDCAGTPYFSAPECFKSGIISSKADIWSVGALLYYATYGTAPIHNSSRPPSDRHRRQPSYVTDVLYHCLQADPKKRGSHNWLVQHPYTTDPRAL